MNVRHIPTIWALKAPSAIDYKPEDLQKVQQFLTDSIRNGVSRFGWSDFDLTKLQNKPWQERTDEEKECWRKANFLLRVKKDDWVVHINLPSWGYCIAGKVSETYSFEQEKNPFGYNNLLKLDRDSITEFNRNDPRVVPIISSRLKLRGHYWTIRYVDEFLETIKNLKAETFEKKEDESVGRFYLKKELLPLLKEITTKIQKTHPGAALEDLIEEIFREIPGVVGVHKHGRRKGWGTDSGADLIVTYESGLPISSNLEKQEQLVVQVKSYTGQHWETGAVEQIEMAIEEFDADAGLIITTAESTTKIEEAIDELSKKLNKPIGIIAGEEVAKFVLKYGGKFIL